MYNIKPQVFAALDEVLPGRAVPVTPEDDAQMPCISYLELNNTPLTHADDVEKTSLIEIAVDIWADAPGEITPIALAVDEKLAKLDGKRVFATDIPPDEANTYHKSMRYAFIEGS